MTNYDQLLKVDQCISYASGLANVECKEDVSEVFDDDQQSVTSPFWSF